MKESNFERLSAVQRLQTQHPTESLDCVFSLLEDPDPKISGPAFRVLTLYGEFTPQQIEILCRHMTHHPVDWTRLSCAIKLMSKSGAEIYDAYVQALNDSSEKVVQVAIVEIGSRSEAGSTQTLLSCLNRKNWDVRLSACKALIQQQTANQEVVDCLIEMWKEPEAAEYDRMELEFSLDESLFELTCLDSTEPIQRWGDFASIILEAKVIALKNEAP